MYSHVPYSHIMFTSHSYIYIYIFISIALWYDIKLHYIKLHYITHSGPGAYWDHHEAEETKNALIFTVITWKHRKRNMAKRLDNLGGVLQIESLHQFVSCQSVDIACDRLDNDGQRIQAMPSEWTTPPLTKASFQFCLQQKLVGYGAQQGENANLLDHRCGCLVTALELCTNQVLLDIHL